jgi:hypothetical protein
MKFYIKNSKLDIETIKTKVFHLKILKFYIKFVHENIVFKILLIKINGILNKNLKLTLK